MINEYDFKTWTAKRQKGAKGTVLGHFDDFLKMFTKSNLKLRFKTFSGGKYYVSYRSKHL